MDGAIDAGWDEQAMQAYFRAGERRALALKNRGPIRFTETGALHPEIVAAYDRYGFYIFENVIGAEELAELKSEFFDLIDRFPAYQGSALDHRGRPAVGAGLKSPVVAWSKPLGDPMGGTSRVNGRAPVKMIEPIPAAGLPAEVAFALQSPLQFSDAALRAYGHPELLAVAAALNGDDFAPFSEVIIIKKPGEGASFAWHQDGTTHWGSPGWTRFTHGLNLMVQLFPCTAANGLWYVPGTHAAGKLDIPALVEAAGGNCLPDAVPLICEAGDVAVSNRQILHASFPNTSPDWRMTLNLGFHLRKSVVDVQTRGMSGELERYDAERVRRRSEIIGYAIEARRQHFPDETPYRYRPHLAAGESFRWDDAARAAIHDYQVLDILI